MLSRNPNLREEEATGILVNFVPNLLRWNPDPDGDGYWEDEEGEQEPVKGYRGGL